MSTKIFKISHFSFTFKLHEMKKVLLKKDGLERAGLKAIMEEIGVRNEGGGGGERGEA